MSGAWISSVLSNYDLSMDQGIRTKHFGHKWEEARIDGLNAPNEAHEARMRNHRGIALQRKDFPEASAVWDQKRYAKLHDVFRISTFLAVKENVAEVLSRFDWGDGGLVPYMIYQADLATPLEEKFFLLNFGAHKNTILPEQSKNVVKGVIDAGTGQQLWRIRSWHENDDVVLSKESLVGPDLWFEEILYNDEVFMSDGLAEALITIGMKDLFKLKRCRISGDVQ
ncbi:MAG TPA: hypothetical protein VJM34_09425 [Novosphingobium sp.]|nr:hypothetical protein [Novosphingobium sp.]